MKIVQDEAGVPGVAPGTLFVAVGPAASGKSTAAALFPVDAVVCLDELRREISGGRAGDQSVTPAAVARQNILLDEHLAAGQTVLVDSTNVEPRVRANLLELAHRHGRQAVALRFTTDLDTCLERNARRPADRRVPDDVLRWQHSLAQDATMDVLLAEGFTSALVPAWELPDVRFACVTSPDGAHAYFWAVGPADYEGLLASWARDEELRVAAFEGFTDPRIVIESHAWLTKLQHEGDRPGTVMVGSVEHGRWVNWNLPSAPRPPVPAYW
ncbi:ATP-binding protein [Streptomyces sp. NPDC001581]|uniref:ATP-binding protein n=1 Tax=Streptomyces sp. NPDC001581 TaxID=3154386 RepID=UPI0033301EEA